MKLKHSQELELFYKNKWSMAEEKLTEMRMTKQVHFPQIESNLRYVFLFC